MLGLVYLKTYFHYLFLGINEFLFLFPHRLLLQRRRWECFDESLHDHSSRRCFLLGIVAIWTTIGSVSYVDIYRALNNGELAGQVAIFGFGVPLVSFAAFCIFMGTIGKSAQFLWLVA